MNVKIKFAMIVLAFISIFDVSIAANPLLGESNGQLIYVPVYSVIFHGDRNKKINLAVTLIIRNTGTNGEISVESVDYYSDSGTKIRSLVDSPVRIAPLGAINYVIKESDTIGGSGASFLVKWKSDKFIRPPLVETIMIGSQAQSFTSRGIVIEEIGQ